MFWLFRVGCSGLGSRMTMRHISFTRQLWFAQKRDVSPLSLHLTSLNPSHLTTYPPSYHTRRVIALVKPSSSPRSWSKSVRRRTTLSFAPSIDQIADPEPGSFQHKAHVGIDEKGNIVAEGEVDRKWTDFLSGPTRTKVSLPPSDHSKFGSRLT